MDDWGGGIPERETAPITIRSWVDRTLAAGVSFMLLVCGTEPLSDGFHYEGHYHAWARHAFVPTVAAYLAVPGLVVTWRICVMGVRFDHRGVTVRNFFRTYRLRWPEVREFTDGSVSTGENSWWALKIVLHEGRAVTATGTMRDTKKGGDDPLRAVVATIEQVAARYEIPAELTGLPIRAQSRRWPRRGSSGH